MSLRNYSWRSMQQRPGRTILTVLSIVIGVTAIVGIDLGTAATRNAYKQMFAVVTGKATLEIDAKGGGRIPQSILPDILKADGVQTAAPLIERPGSISFGEDRQIRLQILGIDPQYDQSVRDYSIVQGRQVSGEEDELVLEHEFARYYNLAVGSQVKVRTLKGSKLFTIVGLLQAKSGAASSQLAMGMMPLERAQYYFNRASRSAPKDTIDKIQIVTRPGADVAAIQQAIEKQLPETAQIHQPSGSSQLMEDNLRSSEQGLRLATYFSILMAMIIILNTFLMNVSERRRHLSIMRAIGAVRRQITLSLIGESVLLGICGTLLGIVLGVATAFVATWIIGAAFEVQLPRLIEVMTLQPFVLGAAFGMTMAIIAAYVPARIAGRISPLEGMNRIVRAKSRNLTWLFAIIGTLIVGVALWVIKGSIDGKIPIEVAGYSAPFFLVGIVMLDSLLLAPQAVFFAWLIRPLARVESGLALKQVLRHHARSALTVGVLFVAGSAGVAMANSILDSVQDIHDWYDQAIRADYVVRSMMPDMDQGTSAEMPEGIGAELAAVPHVKLIETGRFVEAKVPVATGEDTEPIAAIAIARSLIDPNPAFDLIDGDRAQIRDQMRSGQVVIGSVLAHETKLGLGDKLPLETREGVLQIPICGVTNDYLVAGKSIYMYRDYGERWLGVEGVDGYMIQVEPGHVEELKAPLEKITKKYDVFLLSNADIKRNVNRFVAGTEWCLWILVYTFYLVGAFGVINTLTMNVLEQTRELGLLRIVAMTKTQVRRTILMQALIIAGVGLPPGIAMGVLVGYVMNLSMPGSSGRPIEFHMQPRLIIVTLLGAFIIVLLAAFFPARRATQINVVEALHYE
jgi:putative ABC transport system permease protein